MRTDHDQTCRAAKHSNQLINVPWMRAIAPRPAVTATTCMYGNVMLVDILCRDWRSIDNSN
ncbi:hypothetical protein J6590_073864 [Homalodisca vitripennis]|nr:hypothetical protein J6590_073864 [Homalodisca vitripennis]